MQKKVAKILSLGDWPKMAKNQKIAETSPITKRILSQVHLQPQQILPLTYQRYVHFCTQRKNQSAANRQDYQDELWRRLKQVEILISIRNSYILGKDYGLINKPILHKQKEKLRIISKYTSNHSNINQIYESLPKSSKLSRLNSQKLSQAKDSGLSYNLVKGKSRNKQYVQHQQSQYFVDFSKKYKKQSEKSLKGNQQSTKIRQLQSSKQKLNSLAKKQYGYYQIANNANVKQRKKSSATDVQQNRITRVKSSNILYQELLHNLQEWQVLDKKHLKEVEKISDLSSRQRQRLLKIQSIQKQQMQSQIKGIKKRLNSQSKSIRLRSANCY